jgi:hypothetical protein
MDEGASERQAVMPLALVITGAPNATLYVAESDDPEAARAEMEPVSGTDGVGADG